MPVRDLLGFLPMAVLLVWAAGIDLRCRRIPNWLTASLVLTGLVQSVLPHSTIDGGGGRACAGMLVGFGLTFVMFALGAMGGADVKLFAGIGAWVGPGHVVEIFAAEALIGMVIVVWQAARGRRLASLVRGSAVIVMNAAATGDLTCPEESADRSQDQKRLPYAVPALLATLAVLYSGRRWL